MIVLGGSGLDPERLPDGSSLSTLVEAEQLRQREQDRKRQERLEAIKRGWLSMPDGQSKRARKYAARTLQGCAKDVRRATQGERHDTIYKKAYRMGTMVASGMVNEGDVIAELFDAAQQVYDTATEHKDALRAIQDAIGDAQNTPFDLSELGTFSKRIDYDKIDWDQVDDDGVVTLDALAGGE